MLWRSDPDFPYFSIGRREIVLHRTIAQFAASILEQISRLPAGSEAGAGNRRSAFRISVPGAPEIFARRARRGGMAQLVSKDLYVGLAPRPMRELAVTREAIGRGIPVAEPMGAIVEWVAPLLYRGVFLTRAIPAMTLWEFLCADDDPVARGHVLAIAREAIAGMHSRGLVHGDLNLNNLLVARSGESFSIVVIDLDQARLCKGPIPAERRRAELARMARSARKLDPAGRRIDAATLAIVCAE
ncbi:MAG TPA: lipopolysaccharide kinase InaA family protein [Candidatus Binataceae bacterium]|nr:lipopolysaccharide kinase InaA family protein [Candidatus Binataceae bacterium]